MPDNNSTPVSPSENLNERIAWVLSVVFHPLLVPTLLYAVIFYCSPAAVSPLSGNSRLVMLAGIVITTFLIPALFIYILYQVDRENIESLQLNRQKDRTIPYLITTVVYGAFTYFFSWKLSSLTTIYILLGSITVSVALVALINLFWKISAHSVGICGAVGSLAGIYYRFSETSLFYPILIAIVLAGMVMSARLRLNAHTPLQVLAGALLGLTVSFAATLLL